MKRILPYLGMLFGFLLVSFYPVIEWKNAQERGKIIENLDLQNTQTDSDVKKELLLQARSYNEMLAGEEMEVPLDDIWKYDRQLSQSEINVPFAYITIPELDLNMPIFHGTTDEVLSAGVGHLKGTSLPIGGESTHTVLSAHSGMQNTKAFDDIKLLRVGDVFGITVLNDLYCYRVTGTETVLPDQVDSIRIEPGKDLATLVTCTPYGINTHRYLVHAKRCEIPPEFEQEHARPESVFRSVRNLPFLAGLSILLILAGVFVIKEIEKS